MMKIKMIKDGSSWFIDGLKYDFLIQSVTSFSTLTYTISKICSFFNYSISNVFKMSIFYYELIIILSVIINLVEVDCKPQYYSSNTKISTKSFSMAVVS